jgi:hypothetical protein
MIAIIFQKVVEKNFSTKHCSLTQRYSSLTWEIGKTLCLKRLNTKVCRIYHPLAAQRPVLVVGLIIDGTKTSLASTSETT